MFLKLTVNKFLLAWWDWRQDMRDLLRWFEQDIASQRQPIFVTPTHEGSIHPCKRMYILHNSSETYNVSISNQSSP